MVSGKSPPETVPQRVRAKVRVGLELGLGSGVIFRVDFFLETS